jgi:nitroimidazol reductase NimA-like FMN-containing flavoprotein (pyridoxamine 5'-phosphate oxidase superfamily)
LTVSLIDGLVLARSAMHHSANYRSAMILGTGRLVEDSGEKRAALRAVVEHIVPGRAAHVREPNA